MGLSFLRQFKRRHFSGDGIKAKFMTPLLSVFVV
jgi:hypothetical protein